MRIMAVADEPSERLWSERCREMLQGVDLILSAGDLPADYLAYLGCFTSAPVVYVHGNHDARFLVKPPAGCICAEDRIVLVNNVRILGLGGSMRYKPGECMYTEKEMQDRIRTLRVRLRLTKGFDILLTHAPVRGIGDQEDLAHRGFECFRPLLDTYKPSVMVHGHVHRSYTASHFERAQDYQGTPIYNVNPFYCFEIQNPQTKAGPLAKIYMKKETRDALACVPDHEPRLF